MVSIVVSVMVKLLVGTSGVVNTPRVTLSNSPAMKFDPEDELFDEVPSDVAVNATVEGVPVISSVISDEKVGVDTVPVAAAPVGIVPASIVTAFGLNVVKTFVGAGVADTLAAKNNLSPDETL